MTSRYTIDVFPEHLNVSVSIKRHLKSVTLISKLLDYIPMLIFVFCAVVKFLAKNDC